MHIYYIDFVGRAFTGGALVRWKDFLAQGRDEICMPGQSMDQKIHFLELKSVASKLFLLVNELDNLPEDAVQRVKTHLETQKKNSEDQDENVMIETDDPALTLLEQVHESIVKYLNEYNKKPSADSDEECDTSMNCYRQTHMCEKAQLAEIGDSMAGNELESHLLALVLAGIKSSTEQLASLDKSETKPVNLGEMTNDPVDDREEPISINGIEEPTQEEDMDFKEPTLEEDMEFENNKEPTQEEDMTMEERTQEETSTYAECMILQGTTRKIVAEKEQDLLCFSD